MQTECIQQTFEFQALGRREVTARFDGGPITSDAGGLLLREVELHTGIIRQLAECFTVVGIPGDDSHQRVGIGHAIVIGGGNRDALG